MAADFATRCIEAVKAVPHRAYCATIAYASYTEAWCDCDRDERIGKGLAAVVDLSYDRALEQWEFTDDEALAVFAEAAR